MCNMNNNLWAKIKIISETSKDYGKLNLHFLLVSAKSSIFVAKFNVGTCRYVSVLQSE
jgi:hypothetical protein